MGKGFFPLQASGIMFQRLGVVIGRGELNSKKHGTPGSDDEEKGVEMCLPVLEQEEEGALQLGFVFRPVLRALRGIAKEACLPSF